MKSARDLDRRLSQAEVGGQVELDVRPRGEGSSKSTTVRLGATPYVLEPDAEGWIFPIVWVGTKRQLEDGEGETPPWILELNAAATFMRAHDWEGAVRILREIEAPERSGVGRGMVDYWLGIALSRAGTEYAPTAAEAFRRATQSSDGRLHHDDGPLVSPRARLRLAELEG